ncbi:peptidase inhibitor family I36 protein [Actinokineospora xionganensis]|uniref:Peptidase inhibitor family I36 protein n=1 Tax=Actinokineospora xionganensis TaxID=2684470 RepID=A0ABR7LEM3_9PSEU|nr:peptidase inhibitor family I36 protein [Actinokineospora xionganensis]MBC6451168.1 peptidase inhibitor family I36 protein [Actinokineospora xionganensis]
MKRTLAVAAIALSTMAFSAGPASAATGYDRCPAGYFCLFKYDNGQGAMAYFLYRSPDLSQQGMVNPHSWRNNNAGAFCMYYERNYVNRGGIFPSGTTGNFNQHPYYSTKKCV